VNHRLIEGLGLIGAKDLPHGEDVPERFLCSSPIA
jgi:hypothetical protein